MGIFFQIYKTQLETARLKTWIFDVDGTLTPSRCKIDEEFEEFFYDWILQNNTFLCSGSDLDKLKEQLSPRILNNVYGVFTCMANAYHESDKEVYKKEFIAPYGLEEDLKEILNNSSYEIRTGNHIEERTGAWNFSIVGRNADVEQRKHFKEWDDEIQARQAISSYLNNRYGGVIETSLGGDISIDICNHGYDKRQVVPFLSDRYGVDFSDATFIGDRIHQGGNDYALALAVKAAGGKYIKVDNWSTTRKILLNT